MECVNCENCRFPRSENDNNGNCKCKIMRNKTIDVYVCGGETPAWCPLNQEEKLTFKGRGLEITGTKELITELATCISYDLLDCEPSNALKDLISEIEMTLDLIPK